MRWPRDEEEAEEEVPLVRRPVRRGGGSYRRTGGEEEVRRGGGSYRRIGGALRNNKKGSKLNVVQTLSQYIFGG